MTTTLVLGVGNTLLQDEGAGIQVIQYLQRHYVLPPDVTCLDGGTLSFTLLASIATATQLIVVDAAELAAHPGTVRAFVDTAMDAFMISRGRSGHAVGLKDLLDILRLTDSLPYRRALVGIQPQILAWGDRLSQTVADVVPQAARRVLDLIDDWRPPVCQTAGGYS